MNTPEPEQMLLISGIQHFSFCRRQWALIHIEKQWKENLRTTEGSLLHKRAHDAGFEKRGDLLIVRDLPVVSHSLRIQGVCDIVEFHVHPDGIQLKGRFGKPESRYRPVPVEYKRGKAKDGPADALQLCAQALCLEEMLACHIGAGYLFYGETRRRTKVELNTELRQQLCDMLAEMRLYDNRGYTPKVKPGKFCKSCSLEEICLPKLCKNLSVSDYMNRYIKEESL